MHRSIKSAVGAAALLLATPLLAEEPGPFDEANFSGILTGDYSYESASQFPDTNIKAISGEGEFALGAGIHVQGNAGYRYATLPGTHLSNWNLGGSGYWRGQMGRTGFVVNYTDVNLAALGSASTTNYGAFGEYFANDNFTVGVKGGGFSGDFSGGYAGVSVTGYVFPDFAVSGGIGYTHLNHFGAETDLSVQGEYLLSEETPFAVFAGYTYTDLSDGGGRVHTVVVGVRFYFNTDGFRTLVERQRGGTVGAIGTFGPAGFNH
ncbi:MAG TPA: hypothetical protein VG891_10520 [Rhizomicrobium sp.]|nr:hypothetical protein [Rhizomicrobium sp.]